MTGAGRPRQLPRPDALGHPPVKFVCYAAKEWCYAVSISDSSGIPAYIRGQSNSLGATRPMITLALSTLLQTSPSPVRPLVRALLGLPRRHRGGARHGAALRR